MKYAEGIYNFCPFRLSVSPSIFLSIRPSMIPSVNTCYNQVLHQSFFYYISAATDQKLFICGMGVPGRVLFHSTCMDTWVLPQSGGRGQNLGPLYIAISLYKQLLNKEVWTSDMFITSTFSVIKVIKIILTLFSCSRNFCLIF